MHNVEVTWYDQENNLGNDCTVEDSFSTIKDCIFFIELNLHGRNFGRAWIDDKEVTIDRGSVALAKPKVMVTLLRPFLGLEAGQDMIVLESTARYMLNQKHASNLRPAPTNPATRQFINELILLRQKLKDADDYRKQTFEASYALKDSDDHEAVVKADMIYATALKEWAEVDLEYKKAINNSKE